MLPLRFVRLREKAWGVGFSVGGCESSRGFARSRVFSIPGGVTFQCKRAQVRRARDFPDLPPGPLRRLEAQRARPEEGLEHLAQSLPVAVQSTAEGGDLGSGYPFDSGEQLSALQRR